MHIYIPETFATRLTKLRSKKSLTQLRLSELTDIDRRRISSFEAGYRLPTDDEIRLIATALGVSRRALISNTTYFERGPTPGAEVRKRFRAECAYQPKQERPAYRHISNAWTSFPAASSQVQREIRSRSDYRETMLGVRRLPVESDLEALIAQRLISTTGQTAFAAPQSAGFRIHPVIDPVSFEVVGDCNLPCIACRMGQLDCIFFVQPTVAVKGGSYRMDLLAGVKHRGRTAWFNVEADGKGHRPGKDAQRKQELDLLTVRLTEGEAQATDFLARLQRKFSDMLHLTPTARAA